MDGRCQEKLGAWARKEFGVDFPDTITIAGSEGVLVSDKSEFARAMQMARISADKHGSAQAIVVGHSECAGFPVSDDDHKVAIKKAVALIAKENIFETVVGLFHDVKTGKIEEVARQ